MKTSNMPGTTLPYSETNAKAFSNIESLISAAGGLSLSQICSITGLEGSTIQNWVKRGWVAKTKDKKYNEYQVARILIINALRGCLRLEQTVQLMTYINGSAQDRSDDIIRDSELYNYLCEAVRLIEIDNNLSLEHISEIVRGIISAYSSPVADAKDRLFKALTIMAYACVCSDIMRLMELYLGEII